MSEAYSKRYDTKCSCAGDDSDRTVARRLYWGCRRAHEGDMCHRETTIALSGLAPVIIIDF